MTRIVIDGAIFRGTPDGGIARYWTEILRHLSNDPNFNFKMVIPKGTKVPECIPACKMGSPASYLAALRANIFHSTYYTRWPRLKCPSVVTVYDFVDACFPSLNPNGLPFIRNQHNAIKEAAAVIAISKSTKELIVSMVGVPEERIHIAYPAVSTVFMQPPPSKEERSDFREGLTGGAPYLLHIGRRSGYKNFGTILKAFGCIADKTDRHLVLVGGAHSLTEAEVSLIISRGILDRVHLLRHIDDEKLRQAYAAADAMVHASLMEGFGIPVIEALACGTGLILADIPVYREIADGMAKFVAADDVDSWAYTMLGDDVYETGLRDQITQKYTWDRAADIHAQSYMSVLE